MTINGLNLDGSGTDTRQARVRRALFGAWYGFLGGVTFVLAAAFMNMWLNPGLPLGVDWSAFWVRLPLFGLGLMLVGAVTCWWPEAWQGLLGGAVSAAALALLTALLSSPVGTGMKFIVLVFVLLPAAAMTLPAAYLLRWLTERHAQALHMPGRGRRIARLVLLAVTLGAGLGYFMKAPSRGIEATRFLHELLQNPTAEKNPLAKVAGIAERGGRPYTLYPTASQVSTAGFDVHIRYADGFKIRCVVILYPERDPYLGGCQPEE